MKIYDTKGLAKVLGIGINRAYDLLRTGEIKHFKIGKQRKITEQAISEYVTRKEKECQEEQSAS